MTYNHHSHVFTFPREFYGGTKLVTRFPRRRFLKAQPFPLPPTSYSLVHNILLKKQSKGTCKALKYVEGWRKQRRRRRRKRHKDNYKASLGLQKKEKKKGKKGNKNEKRKKKVDWRPDRIKFYEHCSWKMVVDGGCEGVE